MTMRIITKIRTQKLESVEFVASGILLIYCSVYSNAKVGNELGFANMIVKSSNTCQGMSNMILKGLTTCIFLQVFLCICSNVSAYINDF